MSVENRFIDIRNMVRQAWFRAQAILMTKKTVKQLN